MRNFTHSGKWNLPKKKSKFPGRLIFDEKNETITLEIIGRKHLGNEPLFEKGPRGPQYQTIHTNSNYQHKHAIVNGYADQEITLYNCTFLDFDTLGEDVYIVKYMVEFVFFGTSINSLEELQIYSAIFKFPYLSTWYENNESRHGTYFSFGEPEETKDDTEQSEIIKIDENLEFVVIKDFTQSNQSNSPPNLRKAEKLLIFHYEVPISFDQLLKDASHFNKLFKVSVGKQIRKKLLWISSKEFSIENVTNHYLDDKIPIGNYTLFKGSNIDHIFTHERYMLISRPLTSKSEIDSAIVAWFKNKEFFTIYDIYIDTNNWSFGPKSGFSKTMLNNRFLNVIQGLESYFNKTRKLDISRLKLLETRQHEFELQKGKVLKLISDRKLKEWCNSNLTFSIKNNKNPSLEKILIEIISEFEEILNLIFVKNQVVELFPKIASKLRNTLSHGSNETTDQGQVLIPFYQLGQILLASCILKTISITDIQYKIEHYDLFKKYIYEIQRTKIIFKNN